MDRIIHHFCHEHPLILTESMDDIEFCYACEDLVISEAAYVCSQKDYCSNTSESILHKRCAELPRQISHPAHPDHPLYLFDYQDRSYSCTLCRGRFDSVLRYRCSGCHFNIHVSCQYLGLLEKKRWLQHPSHHHPFTLMRKPLSLFCCDACGTVDWDMAFVCSTCDLSIHKTCASLPMVLSTDHHHHNLSLEFCFPIEHRNHQYKCEICREECPSTCWVYYCRKCKYFAHVKCATSETEKRKRCGCGSRFSSHYPLRVAYYCTNDACKFALDLRCALLPQSIKDKHDKHPLLLTYDASVDHPTDFFCQICEEEMHPKKWMYYCRECDYSFDIECLTRSGYHRNIKFGREFEFGHLLHPHPLAFDRVTLKLKCDICRKDCYSFVGFQCELCNYVLCFHCGVTELGKM